MNYNSHVTKDSTSCPGVRYTIRELSEGARRRLRRTLASAFDQLAQIEMRRAKFEAALETRLGKKAGEVLLSELSPEESLDHARISDAADEVHDTMIHPAYFEAGYVGVEGLSIRGNAGPHDTRTLVEEGPPALVKEITRAILAGSALSPAEAENLSSPTTSSAQVDGGTSAINAGLASGSPNVTADGPAGA